MSLCSNCSKPLFTTRIPDDSSPILQKLPGTASNIPKFEPEQVLPILQSAQQELEDCALQIKILESRRQSLREYTVQLRSLLSSFRKVPGQPLLVIMHDDYKAKTAALEIHPVNMDTTLEKGGEYDLFDVHAIFAVKEILPLPHFTTMLLTELIHDGNYSTVYGGSLLAAHGCKTDDVVIKLGEMEHIWREAQLYKRLESLQGRVIPKMFGFWIVDRKPDDRNPWACLVLERFGTCLNAPFHYLEPPEMAILLNHCRDIHNEGYLHNAFHPRNVLQKDDEFRVIDLECLVCHDCFECEVDFTTISEDKRNVLHGRDHLCQSMRACCHDVAFYASDTVWVAEYSLVRKPDLPSKKMMHALIPRCILGRFELGPVARGFLTQYYQRLYSKMKELGLKDCEESVDKLSQEAVPIFRALKEEFSSRLQFPSSDSFPHGHYSKLGYESVWEVSKDIQVY
ncbi:hypothetical protein BT96DRAFT_913835 [Gymnopus androsaceus JB14]|uniref:Protein kinase domain-containing protein n=1 Tax=Gymnopus androsaceus JB14 TaxID=1447944 RepID=A0A6A4IJC3_9AGAR|nr:hypothetical protein BT96DRAFT_913835 [Gymnopus androsaceus JB14]